MVLANLMHVQRMRVSVVTVGMRVSMWVSASRGV